MTTTNTHLVFHYPNKISDGTNDTNGRFESENIEQNVDENCQENIEQFTNHKPESEKKNMFSKIYFFFRVFLLTALLLSVA